MEEAMILRLASAAALVLVVARPVLAEGCQDQIDAMKGVVAEHPEAAAEASLRVKVNEAQRLCTANKDSESEDLARQIREQVGQATVGQGSSGGGASPITPANPSPGR
jgi:hypothetical protein